MQYDTVIIGAGAAGMMCAAHAHERVLVVEHAKAAGEKIRISGGGRCNFTNLYCAAESYLSQNPHFVKSALARYTQWDFIDLIEKHQIAWHEKTLGQLFCDTSAKEIIAMLRQLMQQNGAELQLNSTLTDIQKTQSGFCATLKGPNSSQSIQMKNLVIATGGKSIPKMGASGFAYEIAEHFAIPVTPTRPALVPLTFSDGRFSALSGISLPSRASSGKTSFDEATLFTHRGLSGPAILQISSFWKEGEQISLNIDPNNHILESLQKQRQSQGRRNLTTELAQLLPTRLVEYLSQQLDLSGNLADQSDKRLSDIVEALQNWQMTPTGSEGYRTAEVTLGGIDTDALSSKTMASKKIPNLYFIGEAVDVTGWLGGYNFQWAWSSAIAAARDISSKS